MHKGFKKYSWFIFAMVFLVILAGGVVRMTQSGMGCPDWPKCFGMWVPPTAADQLPPDFEKYLDKQDIDHSFNVYHTWIEYINRLLGALLGLFIFAYLIMSFRFRKTKPIIFYLTIGLFFLVGFQGWLGKLVVDSNLSVLKITIHMVVALFIAMVPLLILSILNGKDRFVNRPLKIASSLLLLISFIQIILGTQVREAIDVISKRYKYQSRELWISELDIEFIIHRSFSWIVISLAGYLLYKSLKEDKLKGVSYIIVGIVILTIVFGLIMAFLNVPAIAQPLHLLLASLLIMAVWWYRLQLK